MVMSMAGHVADPGMGAWVKATISSPSVEMDARGPNVGYVNVGGHLGRTGERANIVSISSCINTNVILVYTTGCIVNDPLPNTITFQYLGCIVDDPLPTT